LFKKIFKKIKSKFTKKGRNISSESLLNLAYSKHWLDGEVYLKLIETKKKLNDNSQSVILIEDCLRNKPVDYMSNIKIKRDSVLLPENFFDKYINKTY
jgi:hypothetical protein